MSVKRICLFAAYSSSGRITDYIIFYLKSLSEFADIFYCADNDFTDAEIDKIRPFVKDAFYGRHSKYDFGSWAKIIDKIGWDKIAEYDELLLVNDSCFGPLFSLSSVFEKMDGVKCDVWGIAKNNFLMSFFLCLKKNVFNDTKLRQFFEKLESSDNKIVFLDYEKELNDILEKHTCAAFLDKETLKQLYKQNKKFVRKSLRSVFPWPLRWFLRIRTNKLRLYDNEALLLPLLGFPFLKKAAFLNATSLIPTYGLKFVKNCTDYDPTLISSILPKECTGKQSFLKYLSERVRLIIERNKYHLMKHFSKNIPKR
ncbi:MAG: hypothetical protein J5716_01285 [Alphaproteobacteria bacterium]|nr:hypothetical protein [Alphaproteobacteria bacterium]